MPHFTAANPLSQHYVQPEPQSHLATACRTWSRVQELLKGAEIQLDGSSLDVGTVVAIAK
jgi:phenylalanine ammonia-lyase